QIAPKHQPGALLFLGRSSFFRVAHVDQMHARVGSDSQNKSHLMSYPHAGINPRKAARPESWRVWSRPDANSTGKHARCNDGESQGGAQIPVKPAEKRQILRESRARAPVNPESVEFETENRLAVPNSLRTLWLDQRA